jgi:hypothetical protein
VGSHLSCVLLNIMTENKILNIFLRWFGLVFIFFGVTAYAAEFVVLGDMPYGSEVEVDEAYQNLILQINRQNADFVVHLGDIKSGSTLCSDEVYARQMTLLSIFVAPLIYTPGDNEWTDCHRKNNGGYDPLERLQKLRQIFFDSTYFEGNSVLGLQSQGKVDADFSDFVENQMWIASKTLFLSIHVVGSNNNMDAGTREGEREFILRESANSRWIKQAFDQLKGDRISDLVVVFHGDPFIDWMMPEPSLMYAGFSQTIGSVLFGLAQKTDKNVLIINGDTHKYRWDQPFHFNGSLLSNVSRLVVPGARDMRAVKISIQRAQDNYYSIEMIE